MSSTNGSALSISIGHAPVARDPPRLNGVVQTWHAEGGIQGLVPVLGDLCPRRLCLAQFIRTARHELRLFSVPVPLVAETSVGHTLWRPFDLSVVPVLPAVGGHLDPLDGAASGPGQATDLVEAAAGQQVSAGRKRDDRFGSDLVLEGGNFRFA